MSDNRQGDSQKPKTSAKIVDRKPAHVDVRVKKSGGSVTYSIRKQATEEYFQRRS